MAQAYAIESAFFDVCPTKFFDEVYELVDRLINEGVEALEERIVDEVDEGEKEEVRKSCNKFLNMFQAASDANLDKMEMYALLNIFNVPPAVYKEWCAQQRSLSGIPAPPEFDSGGAKRRAVTAAAVADIDSKLKHARQSLRRAKRRQALLLARQRDLSAARGSLEEDAARVMDAFGSTPGPNGEPPLGKDPERVNAMVEKVASQASSLKALLADAETLLSDVSLEGGAASGDQAAADTTGDGSEASEDANETTSVARAVAAYHSGKRTLAATDNAEEGQASAGSSSAAQLRRLAQRVSGPTARP